MNKILVAYDGTPASRQALDTAATLGKAFGASLAVVSVVPRHRGRYPIDPWDVGEVHAGELLEARELLREQGIEADLIEPVGDPGEMIETIARRGGYDTIVVGSRGLGTVGRLVHGSVSEHVATHADGTVIVAR